MPTVMLYIEPYQSYDPEVDVATVRKTITLTEQQNAWIAAQIEAGSYTDDSEMIRDLIRREQERGLERDSVRQALIEGEQSGDPEPFDFAMFKQRKAAQHG
jgi:antitoxin ParD1/3/4